MSVKADEVLSKHSTESKVYTMDFTPYLRRSSFQGAIAETLTGSTPTVAEVTTTALTIGSAAVNTAVIPRDKAEPSLIPYDEEIPIGAAVQFRIAGGTTGKYTVRATCASASPDSNTHVVEGDIEIE